MLTSYDQVRKELTPWLRSKRSVRTPLATLNDYVDIFHPRDPVTSKHVDIIEPISNGKPLPGDGVEILELLREKDGSSDFQLTFTPTPLNLGRTSSDTVDLILFDELSVFDELNKIRNLGEEFSSIRIMSETHPRQHAEEEGSDDETGNITSHSILLHCAFTADFQDYLLKDEQIKFMNNLLFKTELSMKPGLRITASIDDSIGRWKVRKTHVLDMSWKEAKKEGDRIFAREKLFLRFSLVLGRYGRAIRYDTEDLS